MRSPNILQVLLIVWMSLFKPAFGADVIDPVVGSWKWFTNSIKIFHADGRFTDVEGNIKGGGTWRRLNPGDAPPKYEIVWTKAKFVDTLLLENDDNRLAGIGKNVFGDRVSAQRLSREDPDRRAEAAPPKRSPADFVHDHNASLIIVKGDDGAASGFICKSGQSTFLFTNIHVVADLAHPAFTRLDGAAAITGAVDLAAGRDIARFELQKPPENPLEISTDLNDSVRIGDEVVVPGNSGGGGVATIIKGAVVGIGPDRIEVSTPFIPGNSGSPIIHIKTGKVIGIATYVTMRNEDPTRNRDVAVRHFGYRIDTAAAWERVEWNAFHQDAEGVQQVSELTRDVINFFNALRTKHPPDFETATLRGPALEWMKALKTKGLSSSTRRAYTEKFLRALKEVVSLDVLSLEPRLRYTYFKEEIHEQHEIRKRLYDEISKVSQEM
jgi:Trypsin-like peptidase domain